MKMLSKLAAVAAFIITAFALRAAQRAARHTGHAEGAAEAAAEAAADRDKWRDQHRATVSELRSQLTQYQARERNASLAFARLNADTTEVKRGYSREWEE